jgi:hypothetical protein
MKIHYLLLLFLFITSTPLSAQVKKETKPEAKPEAKHVHLDMKDGNSIEGKLVERRGDTVVIESATLGILNLNIKNIKSINPISNVHFKDGKYWFENIHAPRGFLTPTGFGLRKGEGYYGNIYLFFNQVAYGFTDHFSVEAGTEIISLFAIGDGVSPFQVFYAMPKLSFAAGKDLNLGVGMYVVRLGDDFAGNSNFFGIPFGMATIGNRDNNLTLGVGTFLSSDISERVVPIALSGQFRLSKGVALITENYRIGSQFSSPIIIGTSGFRFMNPKFSFNAGVGYVFDGDAIAVPSLGFTVPFKNKKL